MLIQQNHPIAAHLKNSDNSYSLDRGSHADQFSSPRMFFTEKPTEVEVNEYMKKIFLQTLESNSHVDKVRINYLKLKNRRNSLNTNKITNDLLPEQFNIETSLTLHYNTKHSSMGQYLKQLQEDSKKTTLPTEIINNKALCSLYYKLDLFENHLISEHEKQTNHISKNNQSQFYLATQKLTKDQLQWKNTHQQMLFSLKKSLQKLYQNFEYLKQTVLKKDHLFQFQQFNQIKKGYINSLSNEAQVNMKIIQRKVESVEQKLKKVQQQQIENVQLQSKRQQIGKQLKQLMCQLQMRQSMF